MCIAFWATTLFHLWHTDIPHGTGIADMMITVLTTIWFMQHKTLDRERYMAEVQHSDAHEMEHEMEKFGLLKTEIVQTADIV